MLRPLWDFWGHKVDDPVWPDSIIWHIDHPLVAKCTDCRIQSRVEDFLPKLQPDGYDTRKECPICFAPGYVLGNEFLVVDAGGKVWRS